MWACDEVSKAPSFSLDNIYIRFRLLKKYGICLFTTVHEQTQSKESGKKSIPREQLNQNKEMKIADSVLLSLFIKGNEKCNISHCP